MQHARSITLHVCESDRLSFLPHLFGDDFLPAEMQVYSLAARYLPLYTGGFWHFIRLPEGGGYMSPDCDQVHLNNGDNGFDNTLSGDAAGIVLTAMVINRRCGLQHFHGNAGQAGLLMKRADQLWRYIEMHPEWADICRALD